MEPSGALTRLAGWRRAFFVEVAGVVNSEGEIGGCLIVVCEALMLVEVEVVRVLEPLLRLRVEEEVMLLSVELVAVCKADSSPSGVPLTDSSCVAADGPVAVSSLANRRSSLSWLDRVLRDDVARVATRRAVSRETLDIRIMIVERQDVHWDIVSRAWSIHQGYLSLTAISLDPASPFKLDVRSSSSDHFRGAA